MRLKAFRQFISNFDIYGHQIKLLYKGEDTRKSLFGGVLSLLSIGLMFWYFFLQIQDIAQNKTSIKQAQNPFTIAKSDITIDKTNFDMAFFINTKSNMSLEQISTYVNFNVHYISEDFVINDRGDLIFSESEETMKMDLCPQDRMFNSPIYRNYAKAFRQKNGILICQSQDQQFKPKGRENWIKFHIDECDQKFLDVKYPGKKCVINETILTDFLENTSVYTITASSQFDFEEFENDPVKININVDEYQLSFSSQYDVTYEILFNKAEWTDNKLHEQFDQQEKSFISSEFTSSILFDRDTANQTYFNVEFGVLNEQNMIERQANNVVQALSNVGGLAGIIFGFVAFIIAPLQEFLFYQSLLKKAFLVEKSKIDQEESKQEKLQKRSRNEDKYDEEDNLKKRIQRYKTIDNSDFNTYLRLIRKLRDRVPFFYSIKTAIKQKFQQLFRCKKQRFQLELFELGKDMIEKQFDIANILKDLRSFKMINSLLLSKFQRKLIPNFKKYLLTKKLSLLKQKEKETQKNQQQHLKNKLDENSNTVTQLMIELFGNNKDPQNTYNSVLVKRIFRGNDKINKNLRTQLYTGLLRKFIQLNIQKEFEKQQQLGPLNQQTISYGVEINDNQADENWNNKGESQYQSKENYPFDKSISDVQIEDDVNVIDEGINPTVRIHSSPIRILQEEKAIDQNKI
ncbi:UNKNOWN [Stylonychia lemnae]|uniref:Transmembrane protein n=1 Tax=Stylonychia lemnae TaxID=5949 RepID=A0A078B8W3_STYLE|nr:UNKNOWN [Stylonychia lemnae]|eukprot:CDW89732.1 UNKNOWN [Stylonychia lemnae]